MERMNRSPLKRIVQESTNFEEDDYEPADIDVFPPKRSIQVITEIPIEFESCGEDNMHISKEKHILPDRNDDDDSDDEEYDDPNDRDWTGSPVRSVILRKPITPIVNRRPYQARAPKVITNNLPEIVSVHSQGNTIQAVDPLAIEPTEPTKTVVDLRRVVENPAKKPTINRFPCGYCDTVFTDSSFLERHHKRCKAKRAHDSAKNPGTSQLIIPSQLVNITEQQNNRNTAQSRRKSYNCPQCSFSTKNPDHLKYHMPKHSNDKPFSCNECDYTCRESGYLDMHKKVAHAKSEDPPQQEDTASQKDNGSDPVPVEQIKIDPSQLFSCDQCSYTSVRSGYLSMHKRIHSRGEPLVCDDCGYKCSRISYFRKHRLTHAGEIPILCDKCDFTCTRLGRMEAHKLTHEPQELTIEYSPHD